MPGTNGNGNHGSAAGGSTSVPQNGSPSTGNLMPRSSPPASGASQGSEQHPVVVREMDATRCGACSYLHAPARTFRCLSCGSRDLAPLKVRLAGTLETWTDVKAPAEPGGKAGLAIVRLDAGPCVTGALSLASGPFAFGARVEGVVVPVQDGDRTALRLNFHLAAPEAIIPVSSRASEPR